MKFFLFYFQKPTRRHYLVRIPNSKSVSRHTILPILSPAIIQKKACRILFFSSFFSFWASLGHLESAQREREKEDLLLVLQPFYNCRSYLRIHSIFIFFGSKCLFPSSSLGLASCLSLTCSLIDHMIWKAFRMARAFSEACSSEDASNALASFASS